MPRVPAAILAILTLLPGLTVGGESQHAETTSPAAIRELRISPVEVAILGRHERQRILVTGVVSGEPSEWDCSREATYASSDPAVAVVTADGVVLPRGNGTAAIEAGSGGLSASATVTVTGFDTELPISFRNQVVPVLTRLGCNSGGCHGKASGQNGFRLSLLGFDPQFDLAALSREGRGRRVFPADPERSLLLSKAAGVVPHGGGKRLQPGSEAYGLLLRWIRQGMPAGSADDPHVERIECTPRSRILGQHAAQQVLVTAHYSDGTQRDVTHEAQFRSNHDHIAFVDLEGLVQTRESTGDTPIMARYMGQVDICTISIPRTQDESLATAWPDLPVRNAIDELIARKWRQLKLVPSPLADDATFLRRAFVDCIGTLPTPDEAREFLADADPLKRDKCIDRLLERNEYADFWAMKWGELLRNKRRGGDPAKYGTYVFHAWLRDAFRRNMPYDEFVRNIVAAQGTVSQHPPVVWYREVRDQSLTNDTSQLFLGTRLNCAQCHHHPYEKWSQDDYYHLQAFFGRLSFKQREGVQAIFVRPDGDVRNPATGEIMSPRGLDGPEITLQADEDPRQKLVDWMAAPDNPYFARAISNQLWGHFFGRGLVEPLDDMRVTNPPSHPELLDTLARELIEHKFDLKHVMRLMLQSTTYQLASEPHPANLQDRQNFARSYPRRLSAEVLLDGISQVTGTPEAFAGLPTGMRAIQLPDESVESHFLDVFGRPTRDTACECERSREGNLAQSLQITNSNTLIDKIRDEQGRLARLMRRDDSDSQIVDELYLAAFARRASPRESEVAVSYLSRQGNRREALEDLLWAMLNTKEFLFNH